MGATGLTSSTRREADLPTSSSEEHRPAFDVPANGLPAGTPAPPQVGDVLKDRYVLLECLAQWSASRLFRAEDRRRSEGREHDPVVSLKVVTAPPGAEPAAVQALRREAAIAGGLCHPNLLRIHGLDHDGPHTFLCMDWRKAESLGAILDARGARPMTRVQALRILDGICQALGYLHARRIIHADIKPGNILVTTDGEAALIDFGLASGPGADDLPKLHGCTPEYASPEVLRGEPATPADDLFSIACVAYRMLSGQRPFGTGTAADAEAAGARPGCPEQLSPVQWRALDRALAYQRADRQSDVETFLNQLKGAGGDGSACTVPLNERHETRPAAPLRSGGRRRYWPLAAAMVLVVVGSLLLYRQAPAPPIAAPDVQPASLPGPGPVPVPPTAPPTTPRRASPPVEAVRAPIAVASPERWPAPAPAERPRTPLPAQVAAPVATPASPPAPRPGPGSEAESDSTQAMALPPAEDPPVMAPPQVVTQPPLAPPPSLPSTTPEVATAPSNSAIVPLSSLHMRHYTEPHYPRSAAARQLSGSVRLAFTVNDAGETEDVQVMDSEPADVFDEAALNAVKRWRFDPPGNGAGKTVRTEVRLVFKPVD